MICIQDFQSANAVKIVFDFDPMFIEASEIAATKERLGVMLDAVLADPTCTAGRIPILGRRERQRLLIDWNRTEPSTQPNCCIHERFESQVSSTPDAIALTYGE